MDVGTKYAVIDLETTGTEMDGTNRIIQFGCAVLQHGTIIQTRAQLINPDRDIPESIQALTGLTPAKLVAAPDFAAVAPDITALLADTVIVAHNIDFDYPFLSAALVAVGQPALTQQGVDTVELAQLLMPTQASYRLADLTAALHIEHRHPHRADSDAVSTANLLCTLRLKFQQLPTATQIQLTRMGGALLRDTGAFLTAQLPPAKPLTPAQMAVGAFVLARPATPEAPRTRPTYPATDAAKRALLKPQFKLRRPQARLMDQLYANAQGPRQPLMIEAGTGLGKSLGYLLPYAYLTAPSHKVVISTATTVLEHQLASKTLPAVRALTGLALPAVVLKSARHYLDLGKFAATLSLPHPNRGTRRLQMRLLVWLTQTQTGDLAELHLTTYTAPLFARIRATGQGVVGPYREVDFYQRLQEQVKTAQLVITNHAFLARHAAALPLREAPYLVVDEAQHFPDAFTEAFSHELDLGKLRRRLGQVQTFIQGQHSTGLRELYAASPVMTYQLRRATRTINAASDGITRLQQQLTRHFQDQFGPTGPQRVAVSAAAQPWLLRTLAAAQPKLTKQLSTLLEILQMVLADYAASPDRFVPSDAALFQGLDGLTAALGRQRESLARLALGELTAAKVVATLTLAAPNEPGTLAISWLRFDAGAIIQAQLARFTAPVFIGATLTVGRSFDYLARQLGYPPLPAAQCLRLRSPFHYNQQAQVFAISDAPNAKQLDAAAYADYLAEAILTLTADVKPHQTLVLFTSLKLIAAVYERLLPRVHGRELLAQGVTGSAEKIAKRFALSQASLLLGAASFFEGIDYPDKQLEQVILTRLPFEAPSAPETRARAAAITARGGDAFTEDQLPRATLRFRQSFGRLIRTEHDRGVFVVLDPRLITTAYGKQMAKSLPNLKPKVLPLAAAASMASAWLNHEAASPAGPTAAGHSAPPSSKQEAQHAQ